MPGLTIEGLEDQVNAFKKLMEQQQALTDAKFTALAKFTEQQIEFSKDQANINKMLRDFTKDAANGSGLLLEDLSKIVADMDNRVSALEITNKTGVG